MTPTPPTPREVLISILNEYSEIIYAPALADHLIASGWVQWEVAKERCAKVAEAEAVDFAATGDAGDAAYNAALRHAAAAIRSLPLTPPKGTEP